MTGEVPERRLLDAVRARRAPAWLLVDDDGRVLEVAGDLARYGLDGLARGDRAADRAPVFAGIAPPRDGPLSLPAVAFGPGTVADVHVEREARGTSLLLFDCTAEAGLMRALQQKANDLELRGDPRRVDALVDVVAALDAAVFDVHADDVPRLVGRRPAWCERLADRVPLRDGGVLDVDDETLAPFLAHFLDEARAFWARGESGRLRSGLWTERDARGREWPLEASAIVSPRGRRVLLVQRMDELYDDTRRALQHGRDTSLRLEALDRDVQHKEVLLHCIVHDLKGPLSVMLGGLELMQRGRLSDDKRAELVALGIEEGRRQLEMIRLVLDVFSADIAAMETYERDPERAPDAAAIVREVVAAFGSAAEAEGVGLAVRIESIADARVVGDEARLRRVLMNLLDNALRHAPRGTAVDVSVRDVGGALEVAVEDAGPGVADPLRDTLFDRFRGDPRSGGMAGLGLHFCRATVEQWGGTIGYSPRAPRGSRFWFRLPVAAAAHRTDAAEDAPRASDVPRGDG